MFEVRRLREEGSGLCFGFTPLDREPTLSSKKVKIKMFALFTPKCYMILKCVKTSCYIFKLGRDSAGKLKTFPAPTGQLGLSAL